VGGGSPLRGANWNPFGRFLFDVIDLQRCFFGEHASMPHARQSCVHRADGTTIV
jgi:hypothetical protein